MSTSDGSTADYYELPAGATQLQDLISHRDMNAQLGEIFRAVYRYGIASHSGKLRDAKKIKFYIDAEIKRLESLSDSRTQREYNQILDDQSTIMRAPTSNQVSRCMICGMQSGHGGLQCPTITPMSNVEPASAIDDDSERMQAIGQNGEMASEVYAAVDAMPKWQGVPEWAGAPEWAEWLAMDSNGEWHWYERPIRASKLRGTWECGSGMSGAIQSAAYSSDDDRPDWRSSLQPRPVK